MGQQHAARSLLSGPHALARARRSGKQPTNALQILSDVFSGTTSAGLARGGEAAEARLAQAVVDASIASGAAIVPRKHGKLPYHLMPAAQAQPWELLPMRAAALRQYPDLFGASCLFFASLQQAVANNQPSQLLPCTKATLDLAKLMRNLGVLAGFQVVQDTAKCHPLDLQRPRGQEPGSYAELSNHPHLHLKLDLRWDALKPLWSSPANGDGHASRPPLHTSDALPFGTRHLSRPSVPTLMTPRQLQACLRKLPAGIIVTYHHQLGLCCDAVATHHGVPVFALAHVALPWVQVAQITAGLRAKATAEAGRALDDMQPLTAWRLGEWVKASLDQRAAALAATHVAQSTEAAARAIQRHVAALNQEDQAEATQGLMAGQALQREALTYGLMHKLAAGLPGGAANVLTTTGRPPAPYAPTSRPSPTAQSPPAVEQAQPPPQPSSGTTGGGANHGQARAAAAFGATRAPPAAFGRTGAPGVSAAPAGPAASMHPPRDQRRGWKPGPAAAAGHRPDTSSAARPTSSDPTAAASPPNKQPELPSKPFQPPGSRLQDGEEPPQQH